MLDYSVDFECKYGEGMCVGGGKIRLQGEFRIDAFFKMADFACSYQVSGPDFIL